MDRRDQVTDRRGMGWMVKKETNSRKRRKDRTIGCSSQELGDRGEEKAVRDGETEATVVCCRFDG